MQKNLVFYNFNYTLFFIMLYFFIYNPPFSILPVSPKFLLYLLFIPLIINNIFYYYVRELKFFLGIIILLILYSFFRELPNNKEFDLFYIHFLFLFEIFLIPLGIVFFYNKFRQNELIIDIIKIAFVTGIFTILMITLPALSDYVRYSLLKETEFTEAVAHRTYGLSESLTFSYGLIQGLMVPLALFYSKKNKKLLYTIPVFLICVLFNARIGFVPIIVGSFIYIYYNFNIKQFLLITISFFCGYFLLFETDLFLKQKETIEWGLDFFTQVTDFASGSSKANDNTFDSLFGSMLVLPDDELSWIIGTGENIFGRFYGKNSDVGYIIQLTFGGLFYLAMFFCLILSLLKLFKNFKAEEKKIGFIIIVTLLIVNIKGNVFSTVGIFRLSILILFWFFFKNMSNLNKLSNE